MPQHSPFKFLDAYDKSDKDAFFGREEETEQLFELVSQSRITLVYGQSGTGKTSLIRCGLANRFAESDWFDIYLRRNKNINESVRQKLAEYTQPKKKEEGTLRERLRRRQKNALPEQADSQPASEVTPPVTGAADENELVQMLRSIYGIYLKPIYLIFDQFEELFILGEREEQNEFIQDIAAVLRAGLPCRILIVMREEYLAQLYDFEKAVPYLFERRLRVEPMSQSSVSKVIRGSCERFGIKLPNRTETVPKIIQKVRVEKDRSGRVQPVYLQIYLDKLYQNFRKEEPDAPVVFSNELVDRTGEVEQVLAEFMEEQTEKIQAGLLDRFPNAYPDSVSRILNAMATQEGTKQPVALNQLKTLQIPEEEISFCLERLEHVRLIHLEEENIYELSHDTLAQRIAAGRNRQEVAELERMQSIRELFGQSGSETFQHILDLYRVYQSDQEHQPDGTDSRKESSWFHRFSGVLNPGSLFESKRGYLGRKELDFVDQHRSKLENANLFSNEEWAFITDSQHHQNRLNNRDRFAKRLFYTLTTFLFIFLVISIGTSVWIYNKSQTMIEGENTIEFANLISNKNNDPTITYQRAIALGKKIEGKDDTLVKPVLNDIISELELGFLERPFYLESSTLPPGGKISQLSYDSEGPLYISREQAAKSFIYRSNPEPDTKSLFNRYLKITHTDEDTVTNILFSPDDNQAFITLNNRSKNSSQVKWIYIQESEGYKTLDSISFEAAIDHIIPIQGSDKVVVVVGQMVIAVTGTKKLRKTTVTELKAPWKEIAYTTGNSVTKLAVIDNNQSQRVSFFELTDSLVFVDSLLLPEPITNLALSTDGQYLLTSNDKESVIWNMKGEPEQRLIGHNRNITHLTWTPSEKIYTIDKDNVLHSWIRTPQVPDLIGSLDSNTYQKVFSPGSERLAFLNPKNDKEFYLWDLKRDTILSYQQPLNKVENRNALRALAFLNNNSVLVAAQFNLTTLVDLQDRNSLERYQSSLADSTNIPVTNNISCVAINRRYVSIGDEKLASAVVRVREKKLNYFTVPHPEAPVRSLAFHPIAESILLSVGGGGKAYLWRLNDTQYNQPAIPIDTISDQTYQFRKASFSPDGQYLLLLSQGGQVFVSTHNGGETPSYGPPQRVEGHPDGISAAAFGRGSDGSSTILLTAGQASGIVKIWNLTGTGMEELPTIIRSPEKIDLIALLDRNPTVRGQPAPRRKNEEQSGSHSLVDGKFILTIDRTGQIHSWPADASAKLKEIYGAATSAQDN